MKYRERLLRLRRQIEGQALITVEEDGTVRRFSDRGAEEALLNAVGRATGCIPADEEHPLCIAARNSRDPKWRESAYVMEASGEIPDLSE